MNTTHRLLVFSDLHMAPAGALNNFHAGPKLAACLRAQRRPDTLLVLNGDIFDFLQLERHPKNLVPGGLPQLIEDMLKEVAGTSWGREVFDALGGHVSAGGRCIYLPGNHDPEMAHPEAEAALRRVLGLAPDDRRLSIHVSSEPLPVTVGRWQVLVGHGHRGDAWNNVDVGQVHRAAAEGAAPPSLPPGSLLVLDTLNALKSKPDPRTGIPYSFVDLLKPEGMTMLALLCWLEAEVTISHLPGFAGNGTQRLIRKIHHRLSGGQYLGPSEPRDVRQPEDLLDALADELVATLTESERKGDPEVLHMELENFFEGRGSTSGGMLSGGGRVYDWFGRLVYEKTRQFFDPRHQDEIDQNIIRTQLPEGVGPRIVICGHTHAARCSPFSGDRLYLNTGTWTDLMHFSEIFSLQDFTKARDKFLRNEVPRIQRLSYAEVTPEDGGMLKWHEPDPASLFGTT